MGHMVLAERAAHASITRTLKGDDMNNIPDNDDSRHIVTASDIAGFANTLDAIRHNEDIPEAERLQLSRALDSIADLADAINPLTPRAINHWLPEFLHVGKQQTASVENSNEQPAIEQPAVDSTAFDGHAFEGPLMRLVCNLTLDDDDKSEAFIAIIRLIDLADDDDKCVITSLIVDFAYAYTTNHRDSLQEYLSDMENRSTDFAQLVAAIPNRRSKHASEE
jgi:hypothetical protein